MRGLKIRTKKPALRRAFIWMVVDHIRTHDIQLN